MRVETATIYQIYPRSFQDSDADGIGDLKGVERRLDHIAGLGVDALWLSPINPSPNADWGYDVADYEDVHPDLGTLADFDDLRAAAHARGLEVLLDLVPCHTSIAHPWFRARPDFYVWADEPPNNWIAQFGGPAWTHDDRTGRFYLHSFLPEQPDLDWRNPAVVAAVQGALRFWRGRGADGFRLDALQSLLKDPQLRDDGPLTGPPLLPGHEAWAALDHRHSRDAEDVGTAVRALRAAAGDDAFLVGEVYLPTARLAPYVEHLDAAFCFEVFHAGARPAAIRAAVAEAVATHKAAWALSNHDFPRLPDRIGPANVRAAALLVLTLPGPVFIFQGDEIGMRDGPQPDPPRDRAGRDPNRTPMQWDATATGGFTTPDAEPWLPLADPAERNVADQEGDPSSVLSFYRAAIARRRELAGPLEFVTGADPELLLYDRGPRRVAVNLTPADLSLPRPSEILLATSPEVERAALSGSIPAHGAVLALP